LVRELKVSIKFNPKSSSRNVHIAKNMILNLGGITENNFYQIDFNSLEDDNFKILCQLVGDLKDTKIFINDDLEVNSREILKIASCPHKNLCQKFMIDDKILDIFNYFFDDLKCDTIKNNIYPVGYICKTIRREDGVVVDVSFKSFKEMIKIWEEADHIRDEYIIDVIKAIYDDNDDLIRRNINAHKKRF